ncbi:hypothetical protein B0I31_109235 [Saccharothrix carnea]|uniref:Uncharacterized protein n=1 Tax=Saccharothrix carnea TaxID=1280637 RepID=A0A2P8I4N6_SACCR|nr:hypothetical protein [Saccharothrix carnea]PSL53445.1 hypothetical protein B0I31_109235 [Saccharothrix carnea]
MSEPDQPPRANPEPPADATKPTATPVPDAAGPEPGGLPAGEQAAAPGEPVAARPATAEGEPAAAQPTPPHPAYAPPPPGKGAALGRIVKHRATQLVAVGLLGLVLGGGIVALADRDHRPRYGVGADRPGHSRFDERGERGDRGERGPERGPWRDFER